MTAAGTGQPTVRGPAGVLVPSKRRPGRGGSELGDRRGTRDVRADRSTPPWQSWRTRSRAGRAIRWIESYCRIPSGVGAGDPMRLHRFQKAALEELLADGVRTGGLQIPRGNAKSTTWAAVGLWALCDLDDAPQVPLIGFNGLQARRNLFRPVRRMVALHPELEARCVVYNSTSDRRVWCARNDGELLPLPADVDTLQGLNPTVALVDEAQTLGSEVLNAVQQGAGKRAASLVLGIGTPAPNAQTSALFELRERARTEPRLPWVEYAADPGCAIDDRRQWHKANPGLRAGLLFADVLALELTTVSEAEFRLYRLGQWVDATLAGWLPGTAWDDCPMVLPPGDGDEIVLGLAGTYASSFALVGATPDGGLFTAWIPGGWVSEADLEDVLEEAFDRWQVTRLVVQPRILTGLVGRLADAGRPVHVWENTTALEVSSATGWRRAIVEGRVAHDHDPTLAAHVAATVGASTADGQLRLAAPDDDTPTAGARAARMAWWAALEAPRVEQPAIF